MKAMTTADAPPLARLKEIVIAHGWPVRSVVGDDGAHAAWLIAQHAPAEYQREVLPLVLAAVRAGEARAGDGALLEDRVLVADGKPQRYGSQTRSPEHGGPPTLDPVLDEACVDKRRATVGLEPLAEYLKRFGMQYAGPPGRCP